VILTPRQKALYRHTCDIWSPTTTIDFLNESVPTTTYALIATGVPCHFTKNHSANNPSAGGRMEYDITISKDTIHFPIGVTIDDTFYVKNTTRDRSGAETTNTGRWWVVQGQPETIESVGSRNCNKKKVTAIQVKTPPDGLT
jgi:hypothetical protein